MEWVHGRVSRLPGYAVLALAITLITLGGPNVAHAQVGASQGTPGAISLDVVDADLSQVVRILMSESKQSIVIGDTEARQKKVTAMLNNVSLESALKHVVESVGCSWRREPDGVYVIGAKPATPAVAAPAVAQPLTGDESMVSTAALRSESRRDTRVDLIPLYNTSPTEMMWILGIYRLEDAPKHESQLPKTGVQIQQPDGSYREPSNLTAPPFTESLKANPAAAERAPRITNEMPQMPQPNYQGNRPQYRQSGPGQPPQPNQPGQPNSSGLLPEGIDYVLTYDLDNSLIVRGDDEGIEELKTIISKLDIAPKQIMIEARFVSIATSELESLGINWSLERLNTSFATQFAPAGNIMIGYANGNLMANLKTQLTKSHGKLVNAPIVTTMNNMPASIGFQTMIPYATSQSVWNSGGSGSSSYINFIPVTTQLWVLPRINNADNSVTVNLMPQISDVEKFVDTGENGSVPIVNTQFIQTMRRVSNGETIVLGGLIRKNTTETVDKIPLLADLPIVGPLFRSTKDQVDDKELLIFLTPTIIPEKPIAGSGVGVVP